MPASLAKMHPAPPSTERSGLPSVLDVTDFYSETTSGGVRTYLHAKAAYFERIGVRHAIVVPGERTEVTEIGATRVSKVKGPAVALSRAYRVMLSGASMYSWLRQRVPWRLRSSPSPRGKKYESLGGVALASTMVWWRV
jgi:hypothetical protein